MDTTQRVRAILSFVQAADKGSFANAARALGISAAAVSKNIAGLETALGVRLMNRTTRTLSLTEEGRAFLQQARIALNALDDATDAAIAQRANPQGRVRLSTSIGFGREYLAPALPGLLATYPGLSVEVDFDDRLIDFVQDRFDMVIRGGLITESSFISRPICQLQMVIAAAPSYLAAHGIPKNAAELSQHTLLTRRFLGGKVAPWQFYGGDGSKIALNTDHASLLLSSPETLTEMTVAGAGIAQIGIMSALKFIRSGQLKVLLLDSHYPGDFEMTLQYPHRAHIAPRVRVTVDYLLAAFAAREELHTTAASLRAYEAK